MHRPQPHPPGRTADPPPPLATELLGHPPGTRLLLLNCDDFGLNEDVNHAVVAAISARSTGWPSGSGWRRP
ncbi:hypothetical protein [Kitasatospora sp. NPDC093806]|uniref:hypothetical protein n=1 Tax=Kitasatospora sp. NPDC093806 TaxID=3155075 RepID=UPI00341C9B5E